MGQFESPLGTKRFGGIGMKEYDVSDESGNSIPDANAIRDFQARLENDFSSDQHTHELSLAEMEIKAAREARKQGKERLNDGAKRRIEMLIGMTRLIRTCELDGNTYSFQTLRAIDIRETYMAAAEFDGTVQFPYEIRRQLVGRSLTQVAGVSVDQFLGVNSLASRLSFVDELPESLLSRLFDEYQLLVTESTEKYSIKTEADAQEVVEDLKK